MKKYLILACSIGFASFAMQSCLDYDGPGNELGSGESMGDTTSLKKGSIEINYLIEPTEAGVTAAIDTLEQKKVFGISLTGQYCMRGGKEGSVPGEHAYQRQYSLGPDNYAQYFTVPHKDFMYGALTSTYDLSADFNSDPHGAYTMAKNSFLEILHNPLVDSIPEYKAINLLYLNFMAQEKADLSGPFTYFEDKENSDNPKKYDKLKDIYYGIVDDLNLIVDCLNHYETRPGWYKEKLEAILLQYDQTTRAALSGKTGVEPYIKLANSLKLRMAMHIVKVEPATAQRWAEEAVASGVVEDFDDQMGMYPAITGFAHPLINISTWGDTRMSASFESLLMSLDHPYAKYVFNPNSNDIIDQNTKEVTPAGTRICGIRSGTKVGQGQDVAQNMRQAYSTINSEYIGTACPPLYFIKWAEVDFLRAEGALRGWNMGGTAQEFYERGILNADIADPMMAEFLGEGQKYAEHMKDYMSLERAKDYVNVDPMGDGEPWPSVTEIGVKWNESDADTTKLEKIITQKYIALFPLSTEAWTELRRTGYPKLFDVLNPEDGDGSLFEGDMIRRIPWVPTDPVAAKIVNESGIPALGGADEQATRLWWDVDAPNF